jgi:hypothetical protein
MKRQVCLHFANRPLKCRLAAAETQQHKNYAVAIFLIIIIAPVYFYIVYAQNNKKKK